MISPPSEYNTLLDELMEKVCLLRPQVSNISIRYYLPNGEIFGAQLNYIPIITIGAKHVLIARYSPMSISVESIHHTGKFVKRLGLVDDDYDSFIVSMRHILNDDFIMVKIVYEHFAESSLYRFIESRM